MNFTEWLSLHESYGMLKPLRRWVKKHGASLAGKRIHLGENGLTPADTPQTHQDSASGKPLGLWYAHGIEWIDFVLHDYENGVNPSIYEIEINPSRILFVNTDKQAREIEARFALTTPETLSKAGWHGVKGFINHPRLGSNETNMMPNVLDWEEMRKHWDGIEVDVMNIHAAWAYPGDWGVSSGCVWNKSGIAGIREIARFDWQQGVYFNL